MTNRLSIINLILTIILFAGLSALGYSHYNLRNNLPTPNSTNKTKIVSVPDNTDGEPHTHSEYATNEDLEKLKSDLKAEIASLPTPTTQTIIQASPSTSTQTSHVTLGDTFTTTSTDWVDAAGSEVYIDLVNDYTSDAYVTWSASLKVAHGNGQAFARLYDDTHKIAVAGSEISVTNSAIFTQKTSTNLPLWRGNNLYKVQIKSLNSFEITVTNAQIKIVY